MKRTGSLMMFMAVVSTLFLLACSSGGDGHSSGSSGGGGGDEPPPPPAPTYTFNASGGQGGADGGSGGSGGDFSMIMDYGSTGPLEVLASGTADAGFSTSSVTANLGDNPLAVTADTTLDVLDPATPGDEPADGTAYLIVGNSNIYIWEAGGTWATQLDSSGDALAPVTGISVASDTTLTLGLNSTPYANFTLANDIDNQGAITTEDASATQRGGLQLYMASYIGSGTMDTSGSLDGQRGGGIALYPNYSFYNSGSITSAGADSATTTAGDGGNVLITAYQGFENTGNITTSGGAATGSVGDGGSAGPIQLIAFFDLKNSGNLTARGGAGIDAGGIGNTIYLNIAHVGDVRNSGDLDNSGGSAAGGDAGSGSTVYFMAQGGSIITSGDITTSGGSTTDTASNGGNGGPITLVAPIGSYPPPYAPHPVPAGDILISGNVDTSGGHAVAGATGSGNGGSGGSFMIQTDYAPFALGQRVALLGYAGSITTSGGDGNYGGGGGDVRLFCNYGIGIMGMPTSGGNITNEVDFISRGGNVAAGATTTPADGGDGGDVAFETDYNLGMFDSELEYVVNSGAIDVSGGDSLASTTMSSGIAGEIWFWGYNGVTNSGAITAVGGSDADTNGGTDGYGNDGGDIDLYSQLGTVENSGTLTSDGGDGEYRGGDAYEIGLFGAAVVNSGTFAANGGDADAALSGSVGGDGQRIELFAPGGMSSVTNTGSATNAGGTGETAGDDGDYIVGGLLM